MYKFIFIVLLLSTADTTFAQFLPGARQISLANSDVANSNDVFALFNNPAGLAQMNWREAGVYYSPAPFGLSELANGYVAYHEPSDIGSFALGGMTYGFDLYRETKIILGYAYNFENKFFAGLSLNYQTTSIQNYGNDAAIFINAGGLVYLNEQIRLGFSFDNINRASIGNEKDQIPVILRSGLSYDITNFVTANISVEKDLKYNPSLQFGLEYEIIEYLILRSGFSNEPSRYSAGVGINYSMFSLDYAFFTHQDLGFTHQAGIIISFGREGTRTQMVRKNLGID
ncbi:MAG: hypothetical protein IPM56_06720 [Ignavibacteriales bacterium]|nr:MAG: hypothetical protein IPM56_06720 [Ignavibacteriales bacterium]